MHRVQQGLLLVVVLLVGVMPAQAQDCRLWEDNYFCYNGTVACADSAGRSDTHGDPIARADANPEGVSLKVIRPVFRAP